MSYLFFFQVANGNGHQNETRNNNLIEMSLNEIRDDMPTWKKHLLQKKNEEILVRIYRYYS